MKMPMTAFVRSSLLPLAIALTSLVSARAQAVSPDVSSTFVLKQMNESTVALDNIAKPLPAKNVKPPSTSDGPTCSNIIELYEDVLTQQGGAVPSIDPTTCNLSALHLEYLIVNIVGWSASPSSRPTSTWYLLSPASPRHPDGKLQNVATIATDPTNANDLMRIYGSRKIGVLLVHRGIAVPDTADVRYTLQITHKVSVQHGDWNSLVSILGMAAGAAHLAAPPKKMLAIATTISSIPRLPDDLVFAGEAFLDKSSEANGGKPDGTFGQQFDNEGYSSWDISAAIPITGIKDVQYTQVGSTVSPKTVTRANAYALAHFYPYKVDLKSSYPWQPSVVAGLPLSGAPLDKPFAGIAIGTKKPFPFQVNIFAGAVFNKVFTPASSTDATLLNSHRVTKLLYGIDIPIGQLVKAIGNK